MSFYDYKVSKEIELKGFPFYSLIMAAMRQADTENIEKLRQAFPQVFYELFKRYNAGGGYIDDEYKELTEEQI